MSLCSIIRIKSMDSVWSGQNEDICPSIKKSMSLLRISFHWHVSLSEEKLVLARWQQHSYWKLVSSQVCMLLLWKSVLVLKCRRTILTFFSTLRKRSTGQNSLFVTFFGKKREKIWLGRDSNSRSVDQKPITPWKLDIELGKCSIQ